MKNALKPARQDKISTQIIRQIRGAILQGKYKVGDLLPAESELAAQLGVSRHTVREALRALEGMGLITLRRGAGGGPVVSEIQWETARESFADFIHFRQVSLADLSEVRLLLEPHIARKAAESFTPEMLRELEAVHEQCEALVSAGKSLSGAMAEVMFHVLLAKHSGNPALWVILDFVNTVLTETKRALRPGKHFSRHVLEAHGKILKAIREKDAAAAETLMREHILEVESDLGLLGKEQDARE